MTNQELFFDVLKTHRESKNIEISEICEFTKINQKYIEAIECGDFNILPTVYMRLFLRSYVIFIGEDPIKALQDFEMHTTGKINKTPTIEALPISDGLNSQEMINNLKSSPQIPPKQIATGIIVLIGLFLILYWAGQITSNQSIDDGSSTKEQIEKSAYISEESPIESLEKKNQRNESQNKIITNSTNKESELIINKNNKEIFDNNPLNNTDFNIKDRVKQSTNIIEIEKPYKLSIKTLDKTKINISKSNDSLSVVLINSIVPKGSNFIFNFESTINFEFWDNSHIELKLNKISLDTFLSNDGLSIRGSYESEKSQLYLSFYKK